jgi:hypothetical protein
MNELHNDTFALYEDSNGIIPDILQALTEGGRPLTKWPIPDLLHMEKNARAKLATNAMSLHQALDGWEPDSRVLDVPFCCAQLRRPKSKDHHLIET